MGVVLLVVPGLVRVLVVVPRIFGLVAMRVAGIACW